MSTIILVIKDNYTKKSMSVRTCFLYIIKKSTLSLNQQLSFLVQLNHKIDLI